MRFALSLVLALFTAFTAESQVLNPVSWSFSVEHKGGDDYSLLISADIEEGWAIYSRHIDEGGPIPTTFVFDKGEHFELIGEVVESENGKKSYDPIFEMQLIKFYETATFAQDVRISKAGKITGYLEFMTCDDEKCLPPKEIDFEFNIVTGDEENDDEESALIQEPPGTESGSGILEPVKWSFSTELLGGGDVALIATATIDDGWYLYSQHIEEGGPIPTTLYFDETEGVTLVGEPVEDGPSRYEGFDKIFQMEVVKYRDMVEFRQIAQLEEGTGEISGELEFMTCDDEKCLPPKFVAFTFNAGSGAASARDETVQSDLRVIDQSVPSIRATYQDPIGLCAEEVEEKDKSLLLTFGLGFAGGLLALLTPCVFPMIPLTVSYFSKDTKRKGWMNGLIYGASIIVIYVALGLLITLAFGATALNALSTNWIANTLFFLIFVAFAFSFFGYYEITLPSRWTSRSDAMADKGGLIGTFFMAFTLALVSFSCTGPIIGSAIVQSATSTSGPFVVMLGFSAALALPFGLFAAFPAWLNSLPRSGSWMNSVKVVLGFLELALAFKFLSVADMTSHWGFLRYELFVGIWILVAAGIALYLFGVISFPHDSKNRRTTTSTILALGMAALAIYMASGFAINDKTQTYDALPMLSGLAPPAHYNFFKPAPEPDPLVKERYPSYSKCANNLDCFKDYYEGVAYAREVNKPVFLDFTGYGCVNCRKTEEHIWIEDDVWTKLKNDFVMISLYVDDRTPLDEMLYSKHQEARLRNVGNKWADFQIVNFEQNSQPLYVIMSTDEQVLATPRGYREGVREYAEFLECGLKTFEQINGRLGQRDRN